eukprot:2511730-Amphidinium_carterae.1
MLPSAAKVIVEQSCSCPGEWLSLERNGLALQHAAESCKIDRDILLTAKKQYWEALRFASDALLEDSSFAADAKKDFHILRIRLLSGRYTCVAACFGFATEDLIDLASRRLALPRYGNERLVLGVAWGGVRDRPLPLPLEEITEAWSTLVVE